MSEDLLDGDRLIAAVSVLGRAGATGFEVGYLDDDVPTELARWWASVQWSGTKVATEDHDGPDSAAEGLVMKVIHGGQCVACGSRVWLLEDTDPDGPVCRWRREGRNWVRGCDGGHEALARPNRAQRRRQEKVRRLRGGRP